MPFAKPSLSDALPQRRRLSRWALQHAWKLAGLTAIVTFTGVFMAVSLSLVLRPTRSYFFPLLSDVSKHQPEGAILRLAFITATILLFATTTASVLHCHSLRLFATTASNNAATTATASTASATAPAQPVPSSPLARVLHQEAPASPLTPVTNIPTLHLDSAPTPPHTPTLTHLSHHNNNNINNVNLNNNNNSNNTNNHNYHHHHNYQQQQHHHHHHHIAPPLRRRSLRLTSTQAAAIAVVIVTALLTSKHLRALPAVVFSSLRRAHIVRFLFNTVLYATVLTWALAMCFLVWYFLKLQTVPDRPTTAALPVTMASTSVPPSGATHSSPNRDESSLHQDEGTETPAPSQHSGRFAGRLRALATWLIFILRPICLTGQAVCIIKIAGLWLALDTFSISNIRLVKVALLAALAFAEYTAAFFFAFFMTILAIDMRAKAPPLDLIT